MMQCIAQGIPISARKGGAKGGDALAALLALPHFDQDTVKRLRKQRINAIRGARRSDRLTGARARPARAFDRRHEGSPCLKAPRTSLATTRSPLSPSPPPPVHHPPAADLQALPEAGLLQALSSAGVAGDAADEVVAALQALPQLAADVEFVVDGEEEVCERDPVHCKVCVGTRHSRVVACLA
jgi:hypothetical protein